MIVEGIDAAALEKLGQFDVAVIGAGPVGLAVARKLCHGGLRIVVLEAGGRQLDQISQDEAFAGGAEPSTHPPLTLYRRRMLGGTSTIWGGRCIPLDDSDFDATDLGDGAAWPIEFADVKPYLAEAMSWLDAGNPEFSSSTALPGASPVLIDGVDDPRLSMNEVERFSLPINVWRIYARELRAAKSLLIVPNCVCTQIVADPLSPRAIGVKLRMRDGSAQTLRAKRIVIAAGGLESVRLLFASRMGRPQGLGNSHGFLGRNYMTHVLADVGQLMVVNPQCIHFDYARSRDGVYVRRLLKLSEAARRENGLLNAIARPSIPTIGDASHKDAVMSAAYLTKSFILPEYRRRLVTEQGAPSSPMQHAANVAIGFPRLMGFALDWSRRRVFARRKLPSLFLNHLRKFPLEVVSEQAPSRDSRIGLRNETDRDGMPRLDVHWKLSNDDVASLAKTLTIMREALGGSEGAYLDVDDAALRNLPNLCRPQGGHHIGTARMGFSERDSVTDRWGALWDAQNVYLAGSAIFPRSGAANPTLTAVALALRTADRILRESSEHVSHA